MLYSIGSINKSMCKVIYIVFTLTLQLYNVQSQSDPLTRLTANGYVKGEEKTSSMGQKYYSFRSVPYAEVPVTGKDPYTGQMVDLRFKAPQPLKRTWPGALHVEDYEQSCLESTQLIPTIQPTGEDCLYLNIYVPEGGTKKKTVLYWIHGGGFTEGGHREALYGPDFLLAEDNIVVAVQYRLGMFGFLNLGEGNYTGNMGLKDQQMGLKWVFENIENFSGNKDEILVFGESAGGASTTFHMLSETSRKYFKRALVMSGSVYSYFAFTATNHVNKMEECAHTKQTSHIIEYMQKSDVNDIIQCYYRDDWGKTLKPEWVPTVEPKSATNGFLTECPTDIWMSSKPPIVDTLFTIVSAEQVTFDAELVTKKEPLITADGKSSIRLPFDDLNQDSYPTEFKEVMIKLRKAYYSGSTDPTIIRRENIALMSDLNFNFSVLKALKLQADANGSKKKTFFLRFGMNDILNWIQHLHKAKHEGAAHAEELCYIFHCHMLDKDKLYDDVLNDKSSRAYKLIKRLVKTITNWARNGDPSIEGDTPYKRIVSSAQIFNQEITNDSKSTVTTDIVKQLRYDTWRDIEKMYKNLV